MTEVFHFGDTSNLSKKKKIDEANIAAVATQKVIDTKSILNSVKYNNITFYYNIADVILPGATYTEQDGYFTNLEGKLQKAYKAS
ncbi:MAG: NADH-quinone oxidoreductase subunit G, partial [SAR202 cluster bacterium]|nr:NADH-quinone oxidoreductase subunit G [SAR202 cluster bacterium]